MTQSGSKCSNSSCRSGNLINDPQTGDLVCGSCGIVLCGRMLDSTCEWRTYSNGERADESSARASLLDDRFGHTSLVGGKEELRKTLERCSQRQVDPKELRVLKSIKIVRDFSSPLGLPRQILKCAEDVISDVILKGLSQGRQKEQLASVALYLACRMCGFPRIIEEITVVTGVDKSIMYKLQTSIARDLELSVPRILPELLVTRVAAIAGMAFNIQENSRLTCIAIREHGLFESTPPQNVAIGVVAFICLVCNTSFDVVTIASTMMSSGSIVINMYTKLRPYARDILPPKLHSAYNNLLDLPLIIEMSFVASMRPTSSDTSPTMTETLSAFSPSNVCSRLKNPGTAIVSKKKILKPKLFTGSEPVLKGRRRLSKVVDKAEETRERFHALGSTVDIDISKEIQSPLVVHQNAINYKETTSLLGKRKAVDSDEPSASSSPCKLKDASIAGGIGQKRRVE